MDTNVRDIQLQHYCAHSLLTGLEFGGQKESSVLVAQ